MGHTTNASDDRMHSKNHSESPSLDCASRREGTVLKKGPWTTAEDAILIEYVEKHGEGNWNAVQKHTGLSRCGKSCRLRWANHLRPNLKKGAFSQEEEHLIIELHAKTGNKWARMAAHLPGRTDNEIKNYWNTRIKRRQRAGLPLYPPEMHVQLLQGNQDDNGSRITPWNIRHQDFLQGSSNEPNVLFDSLKGIAGILPNASDVPDMFTCNILSNGASSTQCSGFMPLITHCQKRHRDSRALFPGYSNIIKDEFLSSDNFQDSASQKMSKSFGFSFLSDTDPPMKILQAFDAIPGSHTLLNDNFPASEPTFEAVKLELPSFQYPESNLARWNKSSNSTSDLLESVDGFTQSLPPTARTEESECVSPCNSGLLETLLHEAKTRGTHSFEKSFNSTIGNTVDSVFLGVSETKFKNYDDLLKPFIHPASSIPSKCPQTIAGWSSSDGSVSLVETFTGNNLKSEPDNQAETPKREKEEDTSHELDITRPDVLLASSWLDQGSSGLVKESVSMNDALAALLGDDLGNEYMQMAAGTSTGQGWALGSCAWNIMPTVYQMTELP